MAIPIGASFVFFNEEITISRNDSTGDLEFSYINPILNFAQTEFKFNYGDPDPAATRDYDVMIGLGGNKSTFKVISDRLFEVVNSLELNGGWGRDTVVIEGTDSVDFIRADNLGPGGLARVLFQQDRGDTFATYLNSIEKLDLAGGKQSDTILINDLTGTGVTSVTARGQGGSDIIDGSRASMRTIMFGGGGMDYITGGSANDVIVGGGKADVITPGLGSDKIRYTSLNDGGSQGATSGGDMISGFTIGEDIIQVKASTFGLSPSEVGLALGSSRLGFGGQNKHFTGFGAGDIRFVYNNNGKFFHDPDGVMGGDRYLLATLDPNVNLTAADIFVI